MDNLFENEKLQVRLEPAQKDFLNYISARYSIYNKSMIVKQFINNIMELSVAGIDFFEKSDIQKLKKGLKKKYANKS